MARACLASPVVARALAADELWREVPYTRRVADGYATGRIDLVFREGDELVVADWKSDSVGPRRRRRRPRPSRPGGGLRGRARGGDRTPVERGRLRVPASEGRGCARRASAETRSRHSTSPNEYSRHRIAVGLTSSRAAHASTSPVSAHASRTACSGISSSAANTFASRSSVRSASLGEVALAGSRRARRPGARGRGRSSGRARGRP